jgi:hypothetical protein
MRRSIIPSLPLNLVFPGTGATTSFRMTFNRDKLNKMTTFPPICSFGYDCFKIVLLGVNKLIAIAISVAWLRVIQMSVGSNTL